MRQVALIVVASLCVTVLAAACSKSKGGGNNPGAQTVHATMHIVKGPTGAAAFAPAAATGGAFAPADGKWSISPDSATLHLISLSFSSNGTGGGPGAIVNLTNCSPTYQRADASLSTILDCPFDAPVGTYKGFGVSIETTMDIMINDSANGLFTDPGSTTLLSTTVPPGGAQPVTVNFSPTQPSFGLEYPLPAPLVIGSGASPSITVVADMIQLTQIDVTGGVPTFVPNVISPVVLFGSPNGVAKTEYFSNVPTAGNFNQTQSAAQSAVRVYYSGSEPGAMFYTPSTFFGADGGFTVAAYAGDGAQSPAGGFLGLDSSGTLCWAQATSYDWTTYTDVYAMHETSSLGLASSLRRMPVTGVPQPSSGSTYASGCPTLATNGSIALTLVAH